ncbi:fimbrial protein [Buttiauxella sp. S19-1]|uniref:fimbrial protein n=1 Tax=Buttiauxella sp. S19-1 TaxID=941430 RepID=UPI001EDA91A2|nr:fimbrial protein [Buttiauxella sp. S19-1]
MWLRMKKPIALAVGMFFASTAMVHAATSETYDISFTGTLNAVPCTENSPDTIPLGNVVDSRIAATRSVSFSQCQLHKGISAVIIGEASQDQLGALANQSTDNPALNVGIGFWKQNTSVMEPNDTSFEGVTTASDGSAMMLFTVGTVKENASLAVTAGNVSASGQLRITYS